MRRAEVVFCCLLLAALPGPAIAQLLGPEFQVNTYTTGWQRDSASAGNGSGDFIVVWSDSEQDGEGYGIFGRRFDWAGHPLGGEFRVNTYTTSWQTYPAVAMASSGGFVVVWESLAQLGPGRGVFGQRFDSTGMPVGGEFRVNAFSTEFAASPAVSADSAGNFLVVWGGDDPQDGSGNAVIGQRFDAEGVPIGGGFRINSFTTGDQHSPAVAADGQGGFVVVWQSDSQDGAGWGVFGQRYDASGLPLGGEFQVNSYTFEDQERPSVAADGARRFVVVWQSYGQDGSHSGVFGQRFDAGGSPAGPEFQVNLTTAWTQYGPAVAADESGDFVVAWNSLFQDGDVLGVFARRFDADGSPLGDEFQVNTYTSADQWTPAVAARGTGRFVVSWNSIEQDGYGAGVFGQRLTNAYFLDGFEAGDACAWSAAVGGGCP